VHPGRKKRRLIVKSFSKQVNIVVLVPSEAAGEKWKSCGSLVIGKDIDGAIETLQSPKAGFKTFVFANRYDGIEISSVKSLLVPGPPRLPRRAFSCGGVEAAPNQGLGSRAAPQALHFRERLAAVMR
jgi:hypothetical protein